VPKSEEYIRLPVIAIVPWFLAGSLFPISALPGFLAWFAKILPLTHALALVRYGLLGDSSGLHNIWHMHNTTTMATLASPSSPSSPLPSPRSQSASSTTPQSAKPCNPGQALVRRSLDL
jgi:hypothetical protein